MNLGINPEDLEVYEGLVGFRPHGRGNHLLEQQRRQITHASTVFHMTPGEIHNYFFEGATDDPLCTVGRIRDIIREELQNAEQQQHYVLGPYKRTGRIRGHLIRGSVEANTLLDLFSEGEYTCLWRLWSDFREFYFDDPADAPSYATVVRFFHLNRYSHMVMERRHILRNEVQRLEYMFDVSHREVGSLIFMDETLTTSKEYLEKYGWGIKGEKSIKTQFVVCGKHFQLSISQFLPFIVTKAFLHGRF